MTQVSVVLPDGSRRELEFGSSVADLAASISRGLAKNAVAASVNDALTDLSTELHDGDRTNGSDGCRIECYIDDSAGEWDGEPERVECDVLF